MEKLRGNGPQLTAQEPPILAAATENEDAETKVLMLHKVQRRKTHSHCAFG